MLLKRSDQASRVMQVEAYADVQASPAANSKELFRYVLGRAALKGRKVFLLVLETGTIAPSHPTTTGC